MRLNSPSLSCNRQAKLIINPHFVTYQQTNLTNRTIFRRCPFAAQTQLNVSQDKFVETEQKIIETEGNVLAFRFLLERFAHKQVPDVRFQVVLTAFQTLSKSSFASFE